MRIALYARVSTADKGQDRECSFENCEITASVEAGPLSLNTLMLAFAVLRILGLN
jgi:hypothetical protein